MGVPVTSFRRVGGAILARIQPMGGSIMGKIHGAPDDRASPSHIFVVSLRFFSESG